MALDRDNALLDMTGNFIHQEVKDQKWYQTNSNFITSIGGFIATLLAWLGTQTFAEDPRVQVGILIVGFILTALGVRVTPNGFSNSQLRKVNANRAQVIGDTKLTVPEEDDTSESAGVQGELFDLDEMVRRFNRQRE